MRKLSAVLLGLFLMITVFASCDDRGVQDIGFEKENSEQQKEIEIPDFDEFYENVLDASLNVDAINGKINVLVDAEAAEEKLEAQINTELCVSVKDKLAYTNTVADVMGEQTAIEMYMDIGENAASYVSVDGEWSKQSLGKEASALYADIFENMEIYANRLDVKEYILNPVIEIADYNGKTCFKLDYDYNADIMGMLEQLGVDFDTLMEQSIAQTETEVDEAISMMLKTVLTDVLSDLGAIHMVEYVDAKTYLPVASQAELSEFLTRLADKIIDYVVDFVSVMNEVELTREMLGISYKINTCRIEAVYDSYDDVEIVIPQEALNAKDILEQAQSLGVIGGADGPTAIIVADEALAA